MKIMMSKFRQRMCSKYRFLVSGGCVFFSYVCSSLLFSQPKRETKILNLCDAISIASDSSLSAFKAKNLYLSGYWQYRTYKAERLPSLLFSSTPIAYSNNFVKRYDYVNNIDVYKSQRTVSSDANLSLNQNVDWTGGTFYIDTELGFLKNMGYSNYEQYNTVPFRVGYSQKLFGYNSFKWDKKLEPLKYEKVKKELVYNLEELSETTTGYFFSVAQNEKLYNLAIQNINNSDTLYHIGEERYKIGSLSQSDLLTLKLNLINAKSTLGTNTLNLQKSRFNLMTLLRLNSDSTLNVVVPENVSEVSINMAEAIRQAVTNNPAYLSQKAAILSAEQTLDQVIKSQRFSASLNASVGYNQVSNQLAKAYQNPLRQDIISVGLSVPVLDWGVNKGKTNVAKRNLEAAKITAEQADQAFRQEVITSVSEFQFRREQIKLALEAREIANQALNKAKQLFQIGKADVTTINNAVTKQIEAESNYISALSNYWVCYYTIRKLTLYDFEAGKSISAKFEEINGY